MKFVSFAILLSALASPALAMPLPNCILRSMHEGGDSAKELYELQKKRQNPTLIQDHLKEFGIESIYVNRGMAEGNTTGDFTKIVRLTDTKLAILFGDGEGHSKLSAQDSIDLHDHLEMQHRTTFQKHEPTRILAALDKKASAFIRKKREEGVGTFALLVAVIDIETWEVQLSSAAMPAPFVIDERGDAVAYKSFGPPLGFDTYDLVEDPPVSFILKPGQRLAFVSDGITESNQDVNFPTEALLELTAGKSIGLQDFADFLFQHLPAAHDDRTLLIVERPATSSMGK